MINVNNLKQLRNQTGVSMTLCKEALEETGGNIEKAKEVLRKKGKEMVGKRAHRSALKGIIQSYIHPNAQIGVLLEVYCETDFVARSETFKNLLKEICLQVAATNPLLVSEEEITEEFLSKEREIYRAQVSNLKKSTDVLEKIIQSKIEKYKKEVVLFSQQWIKDPSKTVKDLVDETIVKTGEKIHIKKFTRYEINN